MKKYEFTGEVKSWFGHTLHRIRATIAFGNVTAGDLGGWIEKEENLSHDGEAWVYGEAQVYGKALVYGKARVCGEAHWLGIACIGSRSDFTTFFRTEDRKIFVSCGCFRGDIDAFTEKVKKTHGDNRHARVYLAAVELAKIKIDLTPVEE